MERFDKTTFAMGQNNIFSTIGQPCNTLSIFGKKHIINNHVTSESQTTLPSAVV